MKKYDAIIFAKSLMAEISRREDFYDLIFDAENQPADVAEMFHHWMSESFKWGYVQRIAFWTVVTTGSFEQDLRGFYQPRTSDALRRYKKVEKKFHRGAGLKITVNGTYNANFNNGFIVNPFTGEWRWL